VLRVWIDVTNSPHVVFFRPLVALLRSRGNEVSISARDFAQTLELLDDAALEHTVVGPPHAGASRDVATTFASVPSFGVEMRTSSPILWVKPRPGSSRSSVGANKVPRNSTKPSG